MTLSERESPLLVHHRIEKNHRSTIILLALVPLVLLPYAAGIAVWWAPMVATEAIAYGPGAIAFLGLENQPPRAPFGTIPKYFEHRSGRPFITLSSVSEASLSAATFRCSASFRASSSKSCETSSSRK
jgi:hypothetical protein